MVITDKRHEMSIDIRYFFDPESTRKCLRRPFNFNGRTIANNGFTLLSIPAQNIYVGLPEAEISGDIIRIARVLDVIDKPRDFKPLPDGLKIPNPSICHDCAGTGHEIRKTCPECEGEGGFEYMSRCNTYDIECLSCLGAGEYIVSGGDEPCPECNGIGTCFLGKYIIYVLGIKLNAALLYPLNKCTLNIQVAVSTAPEALIFKNGDERGLIMAIR